MIFRVSYKQNKNNIHYTYGIIVRRLPRSVLLYDAFLLTLIEFNDLTSVNIH